MNQQHLHRRAARAAAMLISMGVVLLTACQQEAEPPAVVAVDEDGELDWAKAALERNPRIELLATDSQARLFTVRDKSTGEVRAVALSEIAAAPISQLAAIAASPPAAPTAPAAPPASAAPAAPAAAPAEPQAPASPAKVAGGSAESKNYTIERADGQVRVSGPGVSIVSSGAANATGTPSGGGQRAVEPFICEGRRMVHFDNRSIYVDGDAITVRGGCEMHITNSRIVASGTGIVAQDGIVHISNSHIEGAAGSFEADGRAKMYVRSSTFQGVSRRDELAMVQDQGGNQWR